MAEPTIQLSFRESELDLLLLILVERCRDLEELMAPGETPSLSFALREKIAQAVQDLRQREDAS